MKKILIGILTALIFTTSSVTFAKEVKVPENIYAWVESTPRANYFFNKEQINYSVNYDGSIDLYTLNVPALFTYDDIQIQDVVQKRRWKNQSLQGYNILAGRADYLKFDLRNGTVQVTRSVDLDNTFTELDADISGEPIKFSDIPRTSVTCRFYRTILSWAQSNNDVLIKRSKGKLNARDAKLDPKDYPINKIAFPGDLPQEQLQEDKEDEVKNTTTNRTNNRRRQPKVTTQTR